MDTILSGEGIPENCPLCRKSFVGEENALLTTVDEVHNAAYLDGLGNLIELHGEVASFNTTRIFCYNCGTLIRGMED